MTKLPRPLANEPGEEWRPVVGYEGTYEVSDLGRVRSVPRFDSIGRIRAPRIKQTSISNGYPYALLCKNAKQRAIRVHVLVAAAFIGPRPSGLVINHIDHDKTNNRVENLEYVTQLENMRAARDAGRMKFGRPPGRGRMFPPKVAAAIRRRAKHEPLTDLAKEFGVTKTTIRNYAFRYDAP